jgi:hypothetical protein
LPEIEFHLHGKSGRLARHEPDFSCQPQHRRVLAKHECTQGLQSLLGCLRQRGSQQLLANARPFDVRSDDQGYFGLARRREDAMQNSRDISRLVQHANQFSGAAADIEKPLQGGGVGKIERLSEAQAKIFPVGLSDKRSDHRPRVLAQGVRKDDGSAVAGVAIVPRTLKLAPIRRRRNSDKSGKQRPFMVRVAHRSRPSTERSGDARATFSSPAEFRSGRAAVCFAANRPVAIRRNYRKMIVSMPDAVKVGVVGGISGRIDAWIVRAIFGDER